MRDRPNPYLKLRSNLSMQRKELTQLVQIRDCPADEPGSGSKSDATSKGEDVGLDLERAYDTS